MQEISNISRTADVNCLFSKVLCVAVQITKLPLCKQKDQILQECFAIRAEEHIALLTGVWMGLPELRAASHGHSAAGIFVCVNVCDLTITLLKVDFRKTYFRRP